MTCRKVFFNFHDYKSRATFIQGRLLHFESIFVRENKPMKPLKLDNFKHFRANLLLRPYFATAIKGRLLVFLNFGATTNQGNTQRRSSQIRPWSHELSRTHSFVSVGRQIPNTQLLPGMQSALNSQSFAGDIHAPFTHRKNPAIWRQSRLVLQRNGSVQEPSIQ